MRYLPSLLFWILAVIHIMPALSALAPSKMGKLYGVAADGQTLMTLLQHRAILFGILAAACIYAAHIASARWPVLIAAVISMGSFIFIAALRGELNGSLGKIVIVDSIGLLVAAVLAATLLRTQ